MIKPKALMQGLPRRRKLDYDEGNPRIACESNLAQDVLI
jgi:hypothetical protein